MAGDAGDLRGHSLALRWQLHDRSVGGDRLVPFWHQTFCHLGRGSWPTGPSDRLTFFEPRLKVSVRRWGSDRSCKTLFECRCSNFSVCVVFRGFSLKSRCRACRMLRCGVLPLFQPLPRRSPRYQVVDVSFLA